MRNSFAVHYLTHFIIYSSTLFNAFLFASRSFLVHDIIDSSSLAIPLYATEHTGILRHCYYLIVIIFFKYYIFLPLSEFLLSSTGTCLVFFVKCLQFSYLHSYNISIFFFFLANQHFSSPI